MTPTVRPRMQNASHFFFDVRAGTTLFQDHDGRELPGIDAAEQAAIQSVAEIVRDMPPTGSFANVEVRDAHGQRVLTVTAFVEIERYNTIRRRPF
jgi:hypothetical protein